ncbi:NRDE family protein [Virgibacillus siamensis]|uniref:NRDE family protein n=1 Tax=Virgibacillus siamensis TaxID=480071 RepID=UPI000985CB17|nr:NRDE family protein [Virgibacillus siamensis]
MCLITFQFQNHSKYKLIVAANRDEFYQRPTMDAHFWEDDPEILAGRDLTAMGTWLGITKQGRFAALTNYRDPEQTTAGKKSRGNIIRNYLSNQAKTTEYLKELQNEQHNFVGYNVIAGTPDELYYYSNIQNEIRKIPAGIHGLSNDFLDTPWPKVTRTKTKLNEYVQTTDTPEPNKLFDIISDTTEAADEQLPGTGASLELERKLSPPFIKTPEYGTRSSVLLLIDRDKNVFFTERTYDKGKFKRENTFTFQID